MDWHVKLSPQNSKAKGQYTKGFLEWEIAKLPGVQATLDEILFEAKVRAEEDLQQHQMRWRKTPEGMADVVGPQAGHSYIDTAEGETDRFLILNDTRGQMAAAAIEFGRSAYEVTRTNSDGETATYKVGAAEGTFVLHNAVNLNPKGGKTRMKNIKARTKKGEKTKLT